MNELPKTKQKKNLAEFPQNFFVEFVEESPEKVLNKLIEDLPETY